MRRWLLPILAGLVIAVIAWHVTLVAMPNLLMRMAIRRVATMSGGLNVMRHPRLADASSRAIVRPSPDLAYSSCAYDLSQGPLAIHVAPSPAPYWSLSVFDANTDVALVRNGIETNGGPIDVIVARTGQNVPSGPEAVRVNGTRGIALVRILVPTRAAFPAIDAARKASNCRTL
jgi:uncharacterized membrane protein